MSLERNTVLICCIDLFYVFGASQIDFDQLSRADWIRHSGIAIASIGFVEKTQRLKVDFFGQNGILLATEINDLKKYIL